MPQHPEALNRDGVGSQRPLPHGALALFEGLCSYIGLAVVIIAASMPPPLDSLDGSINGPVPGTVDLALSDGAV